MKIYKFTRFRIPAILLSLICIAGSWICTFTIYRGFNFGIDFRAGLVLSVSIPRKPDEQSIRQAMDSNLTVQVQRSSSAGEEFRGLYVIRVADKGNLDNFRQEATGQIVKILGENFGEVVVESEDYVSASLASVLAGQTLWVTLVALGLILFYVWIRFKLNYAVSAILAIFHDVLFLLGFIGVMQLEFSTATIAAVITIIGYSLNDTIVIFDRIRENTRIVKDAGFRHVIDLSVTQSLSRTLITSLTTLLAIMAILYFSRGAIQIFALNLVFGVLVGTYSSIFVASPILLWWHDSQLERITRKNKSRKAAGSSLSTAPSTVHSIQEQQGQKSKVESQNFQQRSQTAEEIAAATEKRIRAKARKKKKKKGKS